MTKVDTKKMVKDVTLSMEEMYVGIQNQTVLKPEARLRLRAANMVIKCILLDIQENLIKKSKKR